MIFNGAVPPSPSLRSFNNGHWLFPEQMGDGVGFIYVIRDLVLLRLYLGKKSFKKRDGSDSGWRRYSSSSKLLNDMLAVRPRDEFEFICLEQYKTKGCLSYSETWSLCMVEAPTTQLFYNTRIEKVSWSVKEPISQRHKARLQMAVSWQPLGE
jgi:hypothetical protein